MDENIARIKHKVLEKNIELNPCLPSSEIESFETFHNVTLPDNYRLFITQIGNGGEGPQYIAPLGEVANDMDAKQKEYWSSLKNITFSFNLTSAWIWEEELDWDDEETAIAQHETNYEKLSYGTLYLGNHGCGLYNLIVVTGIERGNVWELADVGIQPAEPKREFLSWYENWLDQDKV